MEEIDQIKKIAEELLARLEIEAQISVDADEAGAYRVGIQTEETGLLIGFHGRTLESLQIILGILVSRKIGKWSRIYVNVGDYREKREEALMYMAQQAAERAISLGRPVEIRQLSASERRIIHLTLSSDDRVETESTGEGNDRVLIIKSK